MTQFDVPGPGGPAGGATPSTPPQLTPEQITEFGALGDYSYAAPSVTLHTRPDNPHPLGADKSDSDSVITDAFQFLETLWDVLTTPFRIVIDWIWDRIVDAADWVWGFASDVWNSVVDIFTAAFDAITNGLREMFGFVTDLLGQAFTWAWDAFRWVIDHGEWVLGQLADLAGFVLSIIGDAAEAIWNELAEPALAWLLSTLVGLVDWLWDHLAEPAGRWLLDQLVGLVDWLWDHLAQPALAWLWGVLSGAADFLWGLIEPFVGPLIDAALNALGVAWDILQEAWDWIVWFAEHSFASIGDLIDAAQGGGAHWLAGQLAVAVNEHGADLESFLANFLG